MSLLAEIWPHHASAAGTPVAIMLDVPPAESPQFLCIVTERPSCESDAFDGSKIINEQRCRTRELADLVKARSLRIDGNAKEGVFSAPDASALATRLGGVELPPTLSAAMSKLAQTPSPNCEEAHSGCMPRIDLHGYFDDDDALNGRIICGRDDTSSSGRVAILSLKFHETATGIHGITLHGTSLRMILDDSMDPRNVMFMQVIGGHYAPSTRSAIGAGNHAAIALQPRCTAFIAELPPRFPKPIKSVLLTVGSQPTDTADCTVTQTKPMTCTASDHGDQLPIQIPFGESSRRTTLSVAAASNDGSDMATFETSWSDALPSRPLRLAVRSLEFSWHRDCLSGTWPEKAPTAQQQWSASCPRATIAEAGEPCHLISDHDDICRYRCAAARYIPPFALPVAVQFDRIRSSVSDEGEEVVYSWHDTIHTAGEHLHSFAAPADRRLFLELTSPELWVDRAGDAYDEVRTVFPNGTAQNVELTRTKTGERSPWYEITAPEIACTDRVRVAIFGSHVYNEHTYAARGGRIVLSNPKYSRSHVNLWVTGGLGVVEQRLPSPKGDFELAGLIGGHFEQYAWLGAFESGAIAQVTQAGVVRTDASGAATAIDEIPFARLDVRAGYEFWVVPNLHFGALAGVGIGVPIFNDDQSKVGFGRPSFLVEANSRIRLARHLGRWSEIAAGVRLGEAHRVTPTSDAATAPHLIRPMQLYFTWRLWFLVG
ncbi:MAG TPA: hypothetical protein VHW23_21670 [Kofleriaceae bacterium]|jgi:hypothetical protein|nr:hypothetical protein [Kofleriaceae bacterium]